MINIGATTMEKSLFKEPSNAKHAGIMHDLHREGCPSNDEQIDRIFEFSKRSSQADFEMPRETIIEARCAMLLE